MKKISSFVFGASVSLALAANMMAGEIGRPAPYQFVPAPVPASSVYALLFASGGLLFIVIRLKKT